MAEKNYIISMSSPKALSTDEFQSIAGSELHAQMVRNRVIVDVPDAPRNTSDRRRVRDQIIEWLAEHCNSIYHVGDSTSPIKVYIELDADLVLFKMALDGKDVPEPEPEPVAPPPPITKKKPIPIPTPNAHDILDLIRQKKWEEEDAYRAKKEYDWFKQQIWEEKIDGPSLPRYPKFKL